MMPQVWACKVPPPQAQTGQGAHADSFAERRPPNHKAENQADDCAAGGSDPEPQEPRPRPLTPLERQPLTRRPGDEGEAEHDLILPDRLPPDTLEDD